MRNFIARFKAIEAEAKLNGFMSRELREELAESAARRERDAIWHAEFLAAHGV